MIERKRSSKVSAEAMIGALAFMCLLFVAAQIQADEINHEFKSPSFSGIGTSSHY